MPSTADDLNTFWTVRPVPTMRKAKLKPSASVDKTAPVERGIFDDSSDEDVGPATDPSQPKMHTPGVISVAAHRKAFQAAWLAMLPHLREERELKRVLVVLHRLVLPHLPEPAVLMDFLADCCDHGGTIALLALNGLFTLITKFNLCASDPGSELTSQRLPRLLPPSLRIARPPGAACPLPPTLLPHARRLPVVIVRAHSGRSR